MQIRKFFFQFWGLFFIFSIWFVFSSPIFIKGKIPFAGDYQVTFFPPWSQYSQFAQPVKNNAMPDVIDQLYPWRHLVINDWKSGQIPLWNPYQFAGTPLLANYQSAVFSPMNFLFFLFNFKTAWSLLILFQPLLAGIGMYFFARKLSISQIGATLASVAFMFCGFMVCWMGYGTLSYAASALPFVFLGLEGYRESKNFWYVILVSCSMAFSFLSGHFQISLYVLLASVAYFLFRYVKHAKKREVFIACAGILSGVLIASIQIFPSIAFYSQSLRSTLFQLPEIIPFSYLFTLVSPDFLGNPVTRNDWFGHYAEWNGFIGTIPFLLGLFSLISIRKNKFIIFFAGLGIVSLLFATPTGLSNLFLLFHIPVLSTSAAGRIIILFSFSFAILAGFGVDGWIKSTAKSKLILGCMSVLLLAIGWVVILGKLGLSYEHVLIAKQNFLLPSLLLMSIVIASAISFFVKNKRFILLFVICYLLFTGIDMYRFASKWQSFTSPDFVFPDVGVTKFFQTITNQRSLGNYGGQVSLYYQIPALEGYDALYPEKFGEFASYVANGSISPASRSVVDFPKNGSYTFEAMNLLGVQYVIQKISDMGKPWAFPIQNYPASDFKIVYQDKSYLVFKNKSVYPRAFVVGNYAVEKSDKQNLIKLFSTNRSKTVTLEENPGIKKTNLLTAHTVISSYLSDKVTIQTTSSAKALLFLSDTYFPGWTASVDGKPTKIYRADYTFRAVVVPPGKHTVIFSYWPDSFTYGIIGSIAGVVILIAVYFCQKRRVW